MHRKQSDTDEDMADLAMEELLSGNAWRRQGLVSLMAERWPKAAALALVAALVRATQRIEDSFGEAAAADPAVAAGYRLAALAAAEIHGAQGDGAAPVTAAEFAQHWQGAGDLEA